MSGENKVVELSDEDLEKISGGAPEPAKYQKNQSIYFKFKETPKGGKMSECDVVARGTILNVSSNSDGYFYDIRHSYLTVIRSVNGSLISGYIPEGTEGSVPEYNINLTGNF